MKKQVIGLGLLFLSFGSFAQELAKGYVFEDANGNGIKERREKGIPGVSVTNGIAVVQTDQKGYYELTVGNDNIVSVIKPSAYDLPVDQNQLPKFYYIHKPQGSPELEYEGVKPTGPLPKHINFPLVRNDVGENFKMILFGDPQVYTMEEVTYYRNAVIKELRGVEGIEFGMSLGDLVGNKPSLFNPYIEATREIGVPWFNVMGNHDINFDVDADHLSDESYEAHFGPANYAFNHGKVHFIVLDDIIYPDPRDGNGYWGGLNKDQLEFIKNDLQYVPKDYLIVLAFHIPVSNEKGFRPEDRARLFELLKGFPHTLSLSAHTHQQAHFFMGSDKDWLQNKPHHHFNSGTTSGNWYSGRLNEKGIPVAMMADGTPKGYSFVTFTGNQYKIDYKVVDQPEDYQIRIYAPKVLGHGVKTSSSIYANFFMGHAGNEVLVRIGGQDWKKMSWVEEIDPTYMAELIAWDMAEEVWPGRRPGNPALSKHLWKFPVPRDLPKGVHTIEVKATDMFGKTHFAKSSLRVE